MGDILVGIIALAVGAAVCFAGLRLWFALLPLWGFVAGFFAGATAVTAIFGDGFDPGSRLGRSAARLRLDAGVHG
jgi:hypothetical protein